MNIKTDQLVALLGSEAAAQRFADMFLQGLPDQLGQLRKQLADSDWEAASNTAHALKSQCRYLGLDTEADDWLQRLEKDPQDLGARDGFDGLISLMGWPFMLKKKRTKRLTTQPVCPHEPNALPLRW
jgi:hypothetical protein